ncbi:MAG: protein kinase domain-containing protein [Myxococcaceae bacterium]
MRPLAAGGMGEVFLARLAGAAGFEKRLAIKRIQPAYGRDPDFVTMFLDEARVAARLEHPNIVQIFDFGEVAGAYYLAMELVEGEDLGRVVAAALERKKPFPPGLACFVAAEVAAALDAAHRTTAKGRPLGVIHRDVSPQNVLLGFNGRVKLCDFGLARAADRRMVSEGVALRGKYAYMSPEQVEGEPLDARTDVFSLGVVLWELLAGRRLFRADTNAQTLANAKTCEVPPLSEGLPQGLEAICRKALARSREDRFATAGELRQALEALSREQRLLAGSAQLEAYLAELLAGEISTRRQLEASEPPPLAPEPDEVAETLPPPPPPPRPEGTQAFRPPSSARRETTHSLAPGGERSLSSGRPVAGNLPAPAGPCLGRDDDLDALSGLFEDGARLVTLVGAAGIGKTRLALHYAQAVAEAHEAGAVWFFDLSSARSFEGVCAAAAGVFGMALGAQAPEALAAQVGVAFAAQGDALFVLDNLEQAVEHAPATLGRWLAAAPGARFLATSRERLRLEGEAVHSVEPLALPEGDDDVHSAPAVELFLARAQAARPGFALDDQNTADIAQVVRHLDGHPLAIELAAARISMLSAAQVRERLSHRFELLRSAKRGMNSRQGTLRGALDWSWELLTPSEQAALAKTSVFRSGFSLEAAEVVLGGGEPVIDLVESLKDKSLLRARELEGKGGALRFDTFESIGEYAGERLAAAAGEREAAEARHETFFLGAAERWLSKLDERSLKALSAELENLLAVWRRAMDRGDAAAAARAALATEPVLSTRGPLAFFLTLLEELTALPSFGALAPGLAARVLHARATMRRARGQIPEALADLERAKALSVAAGDGRFEARVLTTLGTVRQQQGSLDEARALYREALERLGGGAAEPGYAAMALSNLAVLQGESGAVAEAMALLERGLSLSREAGNRRVEAVLLSNLGGFHSLIGELEAAKGRYEEALELHRALGAKLSEAIGMASLGVLFQQMGRMGKAWSLLSDALSLSRQVGSRLYEAQFSALLAIVDHEEGRFKEADERYRFALAGFRQLGARRQDALFSGFHGALLAGRGRGDEAREVLEAAQALAKAVSDPTVSAVVDLSFGHLDPATAAERLARARAKGEGRSAEELSVDVRLAIRLLERVAVNGGS